MQGTPEAPPEAEKEGDVVPAAPPLLFSFIAAEEKEGGRMGKTSPVEGSDVLASTAVDGYGWW